ncbi:MAG: BNR-4 repeat-containing protein, partial [Rhodothermales bacterium]
DVTRWRPERRFDHGARVTYSNLYGMAAEGPAGRIYNFTRTRHWDPNFVVSDDQGESWAYGGRLIDGGGSEQRPYVRYAGNGIDAIHFITTEGHPRDFANSVYHGYVHDGRSYRSDGTLVDENIFDEEAPPAHAFTRVFSGDENNVAWTSDIELDGDGRPYIAYSVTKDRIEPERGGMDHRYRYARWDGAAWHDEEIAYAGTRLYEGEDAYTGLIALHPSTPDVVYISTDVDPVGGEPIRVDGVRRYEIFRGETEDGGATWTWETVTNESPEDNLRPIVAASGRAWAVVWLRGTYRSYTDYDQAAVGFVYHELPE